MTTLGDREIQEPMLRLNSTGFGIHLSTIIYAGVTLFVGAGAWYNLQSNQASFLEKLSAVQASINEARTEREVVAGALKAREIDDAADRARRDEQIGNMNLLIGDLRKTVDRLQDILEHRGASNGVPVPSHGDRQ